MSDWRDIILKHFVPGVGPVTVVSDADALFRDPAVFRAIEERGFSLVQFEDSISFRFDYETRFRPRWDAGDALEIAIVFKPGELEFETLPADVLTGARRLSFTLKDVFPKLSYSVISQLETVHFDALYRAQAQYVTNALGEALTRDFILQHVFQLVPSIVTKDSDLLRMLFQKHYNKISIPKELDDHLVAVLHQRQLFSSWPLETLVRNRAAFWEFLDERWPIFVQQTKGGTLVTNEEPSKLKYPGPEVLSFGHDDVRIFVDNLFEDGLLTPIPWDWRQALPETWIRVGLTGKSRENVDLRFDELGKQLLKNCPDKDAATQDWLAFSARYAQANLLWTQISQTAREKYKTQFPQLRGFINEQFSAWLATGYAGLFNYPAISPLMVHHLPGYMAHRLAKGDAQRLAFLLIDGLAMDQWLAIKEALRDQGFVAGAYEESALFAWIPSITPISRQAMFAGRIPRYFAESINQTDRDESRWRQFWSDRGLASAEVGFLAVRGDAGDESAAAETVTDQLRVLGATLFKVDQIMHGMQLGSTGMIGQVQTWIEKGFFRNLLERLIGEGFEIVVSADHGNIEAVGVGSPKEGVLAEKRGERCRIYSETALWRRGLMTIPGAIGWDHTGLPDNFHSLLAPYGKAFTRNGSPVVCHGGASLEEVIVPFVRIGRVR